MNKRYIIPLLGLWGIGCLASPFNLCQASPTDREDCQLRCRKPSSSTEDAEGKNMLFSPIVMTASHNDEGRSESAQQKLSYIGNIFKVFKEISPWSSYEQLPKQVAPKGHYKKIDDEDNTPVIHSKIELQEVYKAFLVKNKIKPRPQLNPTAVFESLYEDYMNKNEEIRWRLFYHSARDGLMLHKKSEISDLWALFQRHPQPQLPEKKVIRRFPQSILPSSNEDNTSSDSDDDDENSKDATSVKNANSGSEDESGNTVGENDTTEEDTD
jgi:hypothetical protein